MDQFQSTFSPLHLFLFLRKMQKAEKRLVAILRRAKQAGISIEAINTYISTEITKNTTKDGQKPTYLQKFGKFKSNFNIFGLITIGLVLTAGKSYFSRVFEGPDSEVTNFYHFLKYKFPQFNFKLVFDQNAL